ncbi:DNA gyrase subunit A [Salinivirga cyanobacteriivorans]|uniref:DNA gyrase subunit A n=1 Tax=Salinivirga cyanobacteriivorans TaxID=1307839 RepID=A0A0S2HUQ3_9BACT|nr:DNA gyrase subunit A [Salinivirga cyanobacteriivorans]ALO13700.1 DNA gyrase subunit A [Salinivirga cyanobacteriivorans]
MAEGEKIHKINIEEEMKSAYIDYSMSVIVARALPDVRDGLKPVHRRVLFGMHELGVTYNKAYKKSARIVGEVLGKYHPHGDSSVYLTMVRMAQPWSMRYKLVDGQGNFGSVDGDSPAALRYTEARLQRISDLTLADIDKNTVDFQLNFDDTLKEPTVLPTRLPTLLINGTSGIAVGMATNIPPHNLNNVIDACVAYIDEPEVDIETLIEHVKAPDFPTGGTIYGYSGVKEAYRTGKGRVVIRAKSEIETDSSGKERIIVTEIPYMVNKAEMIMKTAELINEKKLEGVSNINDESDRNGTRIVYDIKRDAIANVVLNKLYKYTQLQSTFSVNSIALVKGRPKLLNLKEIIHEFIEHRHEVVTRRTQYELDQAEKRAHILEGLIIASDNIDEVVQLIKTSSNREEARNRLMERFELSDAQSRAIVDMRLGQLTGLEQDKLRDEYNELLEKIEWYKKVLADREIRMGIVKDELVEVKEHYGDERRTEIVMNAEEFNPEDFYADEDVVITISHMGYIKRTVLTEFKTQGRGGTGARGSSTRDADFVEHMYVASMHNTMLFFTEKGKCFWLKVYEIPEGTRTSKGRAMQNMLNIEPDDRVKAYIHIQDLKDDEYLKSHYIVLATKKGIVKKTLLEAYSRPRTNGIVAVNIREGDELLEAKLTNGEHDILMGVKSGKAIRFPEKDVRTVGRNAAGVRGISISGNDEVIGMITVENESEDILVVSEKGYGKRSLIQDYRIIRRGGKGVKTMNITDKTGDLIALKGVTNQDDIMIITRKGLTIRLSVEEMRVLGRATQGVRLINLKKDDHIAAIAYAESNGDDEIEDAQVDDDNSPEEQ